MAYIIKYLYSLLREVYEEHEDPRTIHLPMVGSPLPIFFILLAYLMFVLHFGPKWMEKRKPYDLKHIMKVYNALQVIANVILLLWGVANSYLRKEFSFTCQPIDYTNTTPWMWKLIFISYGYFLTKILDLFDTIVFILRKKNNQVTFLHVYHHAGMVFVTYVHMTFLAGSHATMLGVINLFVHTIMYAYYFITSIKPVGHRVWWKRYITQLQLIQFGYLVIHFFISTVFNHCHYPIVVSFVGLSQNFFMFALFFDFYYKTYIRKPSAQSIANGGQQQIGEEFDDLRTVESKIIKSS